MHHAAPQAVNPFALLTDPEAIFRAVEASPRLEGLNRRICRPLDRMQRGDEEQEGSPQGAPVDTPAERDLDALEPRID